MKKSKLLNIGLLLTSLIGYHEWGLDNHAFVFQMEWEAISKMIKDFSSGLHPLVLLPIIGQFLLVLTLFQKAPAKIITFLGIGMISLLLLFFFLIGLFNLNPKTIFTFLPFIIFSIITIQHYRQIKKLPLSP